uniref:RNase H type-1 domain-containing protein n=1 Tax=Gossypium arboreum TaxID=29729 RepID=A0ABR0R4X0_GOSAR|nr:hypothetical protein PVK06_002414 [Gossypium arboreum]
MGQDEQNKQLIAIFLWALWYRRNKLIHEGVKFSLQDLLGFIRGYGQEISLCQEKLGVSCRSLPKEFWSPPDLGFIKLNFNTTFQSDSRTFTTTILARGSKGEIVGAETYLFEDVVDAFLAEARACERALLFAFRMGFRCLVVERDSLTVIKKKLKIKEEDKSILRSIIHHIRNLENCFEEVSYLFVPRLVNRAAHTLAIEGRRRQSSSIWVDGVPVSVKMIVENDWMVWTQRHQSSL